MAEAMDAADMPGVHSKLLKPHRNLGDAFNMFWRICCLVLGCFHLTELIEDVLAACVDGEFTLSNIDWILVFLLLGMVSEILSISDWHDGFPNHRGTDLVDDLPFVTGAISHQRRGVRVQVRVREPRKSRPPPGSGGGKSSNAAARKLTSQMKEAKSATELLNILDGVVDGPIFNDFHASAAYHSLAAWKRTGGLTPSDKASPVLPRLAARVKEMALKSQLPLKCQTFFGVWVSCPMVWIFPMAC